jgi:hypothetical protein
LGAPFLRLPIADKPLHGQSLIAALGAISRRAAYHQSFLRSAWSRESISMLSILLHYCLSQFLASIKIVKHGPSTHKIPVFSELSEAYENDMLVLDVPLSQ